MVARFDKLPIHPQTRATVALWCVLLAIFVLSLRLWQLQVVEGEYYRERSENNRVRTLYLPPPRGEILDRNGVVVAKNRPAFDIELIEEDVRDRAGTIARLAQVSGVDEEILVKNLKQDNRKRRKFEPKLLLKDVPYDVVARISAHQYELPGISVGVRPAREYVDGAQFAHVIGYIGEITPGQLEATGGDRYRLGDLVGQFGIEAQWEDDLQGTRGIQPILVDASGAKIGDAAFGAVPASPGKNIVLTMDKDLQAAAAEGLGDNSGAVVALDPQTGELLALYSSPSFDPGQFSQRMSAAQWRDLTGGAGKAMNNRAVQGEYPPGSVFKIFMAAAALAEKIISPDERISCPGYYYVGKRRFNCHKKTGHGAVNLKEAIIMSCDVYFYTVGQRLGIDRIHDYAVKFGLGKRTGLKLIAERAGLIPSSEWKRRRFRRPEDKKWFPGETPSVVIGQGAVTTTPLQIARALAAAVNGGKLVTPHVVHDVVSANGVEHERTEPETIGVVGIDEKILAAVQEALVGVVNDPQGTARRAQLPRELNITVGGKTGTAQVASLELSKLGKHLEDHAWFAGYAPADKPSIVVVAIVENGGHGGAAAAPVVQKVLESYFRKIVATVVKPPKTNEISPKS